MSVSRRAQAIPASVTFAIDARVRQLRSEGVDVIGLGAGQPDFPSPPAALEAARRFLEDGHVGYTATAGIAELREAAAGLLSRATAVEYAPQQVVVTNGAKEALALAIAAVADPHDEILLPLPTWISYGPMARIVDVTPKPVPTTAESGFKLTPEALDKAISARTRAVVLNSPCNPTGAVYTRDELAALAEVITARDILVLSDEIYWTLVFEGEHVSPASLPGMAERTVVINGLSKSHAMTGWRLGLLAAPDPIARAVVSLKSHLSSNVSAPAQHAALGAITGDDDWPARMHESFHRRRALTLEALANIPGLSLTPPSGAFYVFPRVDGLYGGEIAGSVDFCGALLDEVQLAAVPGAAFGEDRCIRLSIAAADEVLAEGLGRLTRFCAHLRTGEAVG